MPAPDAAQLFLGRTGTAAESDPQLQDVLDPVVVVGHGVGVRGGHDLTSSAIAASGALASEVGQVRLGQAMAETGREEEERRK